MLVLEARSLHDACRRQRLPDRSSRPVAQRTKHIGKMRSAGSRASRPIRSRLVAIPSRRRLNRCGRWTFWTLGSEEKGSIVRQKYDDTFGASIQTGTAVKIAPSSRSGTVFQINAQQFSDSPDNRNRRVAVSCARISLTNGRVSRSQTWLTCRWLSRRVRSAAERFPGPQNKAFVASVSSTGFSPVRLQRARRRLRRLLRDW